MTSPMRRHSASACAASARLGTKKITMRAPEACAYHREVNVLPVPQAEMS